MVNASSNFCRLTIKNEATYGVPVNSTSCDVLRFVDEGLEAEYTFTESPEITSSRTSSPGIVTDTRAGGPINCALSLGGDYNNLIRGSLYSAASFGGDVSMAARTDISFDEVDNSINTGAGNFLDPAKLMVVGRILTASGSTSNDTKFFKIAKIVSATKMILALDFVATESVGASIVVTSAQYMVNGTTQTSRTIERKYTDLSSEYAAYTGSIVDNCRVNIGAQDFVRISFDVRCKEELRSRASVLSNTVNAATTNPIINGKSGVHGVYEGGPCGEELTGLTSVEYVAVTFTSVFGTDILTHTGVDLPTGTRVRVSTSGGGSYLPPPLVANTDYWTIRQGPTTSKLAETLILALAGTPIDLITDNGSGTHTITPQDQIQVTTSVDHNLNTGDIVVIYGHTIKTTVNGVFQAWKLSGATFALRHRDTGAIVVATGLANGTAGTVVKVPSKVCFTAIDWAIQNNLQDQSQISESCGNSVVAGRLGTSGNMSFFMPDQRILSKIGDQARSSICVVFVDSLGQWNAWDFPDIEFRSQSGTGSSGNDQPIVPTVQWGAVLSNTEALQVRISRG